MSKHWGPIEPRKRQGTPAEILTHEIERLATLLMRLGQMQARLTSDKEVLWADFGHRAADGFFSARILPTAARMGKIKAMLTRRAIDLREWGVYQLGRAVVAENQLEYATGATPF